MFTSSAQLGEAAPEMVSRGEAKGVAVLAAPGPEKHRCYVAQMCFRPRMERKWSNLDQKSQDWGKARQNSKNL